MLTTNPSFRYRYALLSPNGVKMECGIDRIADLEALPNSGFSDTCKHVEVNDTWEEFTVKLTVLVPKIPKDKSYEQVVM